MNKMVRRTQAPVDTARHGDFERLDKIFNTFGQSVFSLALAHMFNLGIDCFKNNDKQKTLEECDKDAASQQEAGKQSIITPELLRMIVECAFDISEIDLFTTLKYIQNFVEIW